MTALFCFAPESQETLISAGCLPAPPRPALRFGGPRAGGRSLAASPCGARLRWALLREPCGCPCHHIPRLLSCSPEAMWASHGQSSSSARAASGWEIGPTAPASLKIPKPAAFHRLLTLFVHLNQIVSLTWHRSRASSEERQQQHHWQLAGSWP